MTQITKDISLNLSEVEFTFITSQGPGGQNVNKVATAVQLRFNVLQSPSLPENVRTRLQILFKNKITNQGDLIIKASRFRTQERNKQDALNRLYEFIRIAATPVKNRKKTKPTYSSKQRRLNTKKLHGMKKSLRRVSE